MSISDIKIAQSGRYICKSDWCWDKKSSPEQDFDLWVILDGKGRLMTSGKRYELSSGDCFLLRGSDNYYGDNSKLHPLKVIFIHFDFCNKNGEIIKPEESELLSLYGKKITFRDFVINSRIEMAKLHLRSSSASVSKIAELLGYNDIYLFSKQFKKKTTITPTDYRKNTLKVS